MKFANDHYFSIGHEHVVAGLPCQDHALSFSSDERAGAVVSDGCSSGKETDMGARIITFSTLQAMKYGDLSISSLKDESKENRQKASTLFGLAREDMLATKLMCYVNECRITIHLEGDGVVALKRTDGSMFFYRYDWSENMPCYPSYDEDNFEGFLKAQAAFSGSGLSETLYEVKEDVCTMNKRLLSVEDGTKGIMKEFDASTISFVALLSDGITQVEGMDWMEALTSVLSFKNLNGQFVKRRLLKLMKDWAKKGVRPLDDMSIAVIAIIHEGEDHDNHQE